MGRNKRILDLRRLEMLPTTYGTVVFWHEYGIVKELPINVIISGDVLISNLCTMQYTSNQQKSSNSVIMTAVFVKLIELTLKVALKRS